MAVEIWPNLYLGGSDSVGSARYYKSVVSLYGTDLSAFEGGNILKIQIDDLPTENILQHFEPVCQFINEKIEKGTILF